MRIRCLRGKNVETYILIDGCHRCAQEGGDGGHPILRNILPCPLPNTGSLMSKIGFLDQNYGLFSSLEALPCTPMIGAYIINQFSAFVAFPLFIANSSSSLISK